MSSSIAESILEASQVLSISGVPQPRREASSLLQDVIGRDRTFVISHADDVLTAEQLQRFRQFVDRRAAGEPLQYITGRQSFFGLNFQVTKDVLIPRPETELLVETALTLVNSHDQPLVCDVGTGSGCIAVALLHENQGAAAVGIDLSEAAIRVARENATRHSVSSRLSLLVADGLTSLQAEHPTFDLVVSNPPYVAGSAVEGLQREVRDHEPRLALLAGPDGLDMIRRLLSESGSFVKTGGHLLIEIGFDQGAAVERLIDRNSWRLVDIHPDLQGIPRIVALEKTAPFPR